LLQLKNVLQFEKKKQLDCFVFWINSSETLLEHLSGF